MKTHPRGRTSTAALNARARVEPRPPGLGHFREKKRWKLPLALAAGLIAVTGCQNVKPWQRGALADYTMRADRDPIGLAQDEHIFFSREAAAGGRGVGGGGCGCN